MANRQILTFQISDNTIGVDIDSLREINKSLYVTPVPRSKAHVAGVSNLRGRIVVVFDLAHFLGLKYENTDPCHIVLKENDVSLLADSINETMNIQEDQIEPLSATVSGEKNKFFDGVLKTEKGLVKIINTKKILKL